LPHKFRRGKLFHPGADYLGIKDMALRAILGAPSP
jgi:hypothetical protein